MSEELDQGEVCEVLNGGCENWKLRYAEWSVIGVSKCTYECNDASGATLRFSD